MNGEGDGQQNSGEPEATVEDGNDGRQNRGRGQGARVKVLIGERDADAGHGKREQDGDGAPPRPIAREAGRSSGG